MKKSFPQHNIFMTEAVVFFQQMNIFCSHFQLFGYRIAVNIRKIALYLNPTRIFDLSSMIQKLWNTLFAHNFLTTSQVQPLVNLKKLRTICLQHMVTHIEIHAKMKTILKIFKRSCNFYHLQISHMTTNSYFWDMSLLTIYNFSLRNCLETFNCGVICFAVTVWSMPLRTTNSTTLNQLV